ncbi:MAG: hypothetical protein DSY93_01880 [SAR324 cluster bacterium]|uniref:Uncharacterized protein n=1 Tax=SAR324 cluster bacterium TaxID=2024889 RepID=A0A432H8P7_9DELT|nr:MAG: hypothetical protein DSY93_01880 [SAR324 cluster bacterium]
MAITTSTVMRSHESKKSAAIASIAVSLARQKNDPLFNKLKKFRGMWKDAKNQILQKYSNEANQKWVKKQSER